MSTTTTEKNSNTYQTINPFTEEVIRDFEFESLAQAREKVTQADKAFKGWSTSTFNERAKILNKMSKLLESNKEDLAKLMTREMGKRYAEGLQEVELCQGIFKFCAENMEKFLSDEKREFEQGSHALVSFRPSGVILAIEPWNFPLYQVIRYSAHAIASGNTTLCKHAKNVWGMAERIEELYLEAGLPKNVFQSLYVESELIEKLIEMDEIKGVTLTGSAKAGRAVAEAAGKNLKKSVIELGGSDAYLVLEDANIDFAVETLFKGRLQNAGQVCTSPKRLIILDSVYDDFKKKLLEKVKEAQMGDPMEKATQLAPMARKDLLETLHKQVDESIEKGAVCLAGGNIEPRDGFFFQATVLENISPGMPAYDDELFGPVFLLFRASDEEDAIRIANDHEYGLGGGVFSSNFERALEISKNKIDSGMCSINGVTSASPNIPFGGVNNSGYGREHDRFAFQAFTNIKSIFVHQKEK